MLNIVAAIAITAATLGIAANVERVTLEDSQRGIISLNCIFYPVGGSIRRFCF